MLKCSNSTPSRNGVDTREWRHKKIPEFTFLQQKNIGNTSWNTGVWKRKLTSIANGKVKCVTGNIVAQTRAKFILKMRNSTSPNFIPPTVGRYFSFEETLCHHINESLAVASTGIGVTFFGNPYVKDLLQGLNPCHRSVYHLKMARILRCICTIQNKEVSRMRGIYR